MQRTSINHKCLQTCPSQHRSENQQLVATLGLEETLRRHGEGSLTCADGSKFEGQFVDNQMHGKGVYKWNDGRMYTGEWSRHRKVVHSLTQLGSSSEELEDHHEQQLSVQYRSGSRMHGHGTFTWADGRSYKGQYVNDLKDFRSAFRSMRFEKSSQCRCHNRRSVASSPCFRSFRAACQWHCPGVHLRVLTRLDSMN
eukprot:1471518-Amphidinium_carterae.1